ncbi:hypothetical protein IWZ01DRAFT_326682 [Phyllosticta capitalensis]
MRQSIASILPIDAGWAVEFFEAATKTLPQPFHDAESENIEISSLPQRVVVHNDQVTTTLHNMEQSIPSTLTVEAKRTPLRHHSTHLSEVRTCLLERVPSSPSYIPRLCREYAITPCGQCHRTRRVLPSTHSYCPPSTTLPSLRSLQPLNLTVITVYTCFHINMLSLPAQSESPSSLLAQNCRHVIGPNLAIITVYIPAFSLRTPHHQQSSHGLDRRPQSLGPALLNPAQRPSCIILTLECLEHPGGCRVVRNFVFNDLAKAFRYALATRRCSWRAWRAKPTTSWTATSPKSPTPKAPSLTS